MFAIILVVFGGFACLFPVAYYCLVLTNLNNRRRPTVVSGPADFAGVLLATSGFLIVGGPVVLTGVYDGWRRWAMRGSFATIRAALDDPTWPWLLLWVSYFAAVVGGAAWLLWRRRVVTVVYNIDPAGGRKLVGDVLDRLGLPWMRRGDVYAIGLADRPAAAEPTLLEVTGAPALRHMTLRWAADRHDLRRNVETVLRDVLQETEAPNNPVSGWLLTAATGLFALLLLILGLFIWFLHRLNA